MVSHTHESCLAWEERVEREFWDLLSRAKALSRGRVSTILCSEYNFNLSVWPSTSNKAFA